MEAHLITPPTHSLVYGGAWGGTREWSLLSFSPSLPPASLSRPSLSPEHTHTQIKGVLNSFLRAGDGAARAPLSPSLSVIHKSMSLEYLV